MSSPEVSLIFPPFVDPRAPYLAVPTLCSYLRVQGVSVVGADWNLRWFCDALDGKYLDQHLATSAESAFVAQNINWAVALLRNPDRFRLIREYERARNVIDLALLLLSRRHHGWLLSLRDPTAADRGPQECIEALSCDVSSPFDSLLVRYTQELAVSVPINGVVGVSVSNLAQLQPAMFIGREMKRRGSKVLLGGAAITLIREQLIASKRIEEYADAAVVYEGELALRRILDRLKSGYSSLADIPNVISFSQDGASFVPECRSLDLDDLPTPDFSDLPLKDYFSPFPVLPLLTSKGCSWGRCTFCSIPSTSGAGGESSRARALDTVVSDIKALRELNGVDSFFFVDENIDHTRLIQLSEKLRVESAGIQWVAFSRFDRRMTAASAAALFAGGCRKLLMGLESASERILRLMKKGTTPNIVDDNLEHLSAADIAVNLFCMVGFPSETEAEMDETLHFVLSRLDLLRRPGFSCSFSEFKLDPLSPLGRQMALREPGSGPLTLESNPVAGGCRRKFNKAIRDAALPLVMVGWEEHSLLMIRLNAELLAVDQVSRLSAMRRLTSEPLTILQSTMWIEAEVDSPATATRNVMLINTDDSSSLICGAGVVSILSLLRTPRPVASLYDELQTRWSIPLEAAATAVSQLWRNGLVKEVHGE